MVDEEFVNKSIEYLEELGLTLYIKTRVGEFGAKADPADLIIQDKMDEGVIEVYGKPRNLDLALILSLKVLLNGGVASTEKERDEQKLLSQLIARMGMAGDDPKDVAREMLSELSKAVNADASAFFFFEEHDPDRLVCLCARGGAEGEIENKKIPLNGSLAGMAYLTAQPVLIADASLHPRHYREFDAYYRTENITVIPIKGRQRILGVIELLNKPGGFSIEDLVLLTRLASTAGVILENAIVRHQFGVLLEDALNALVEALNSRTKGAQSHSQRVQKLSMKLGRCLGLAEELLKSLKIASLIFDVGKIGVRDSILNKSESLTPEEYEEVKRHVLYGVEILSRVEDIPEEVIEAVKYHHERWNGQGYPEGLSGESIPILARIVGISDVYCALTEDRPYRSALEKSEAMKYIKRESGTLFDPDLVRCLQEVENL